MNFLTWEQTAQWFRQQPDQAEVVRNCYLDDPLIQAAERFTDSEEWKAVREFVPHSGGHALDIGAGRGIASYALARAGWRVVALEPDPSALVGATAIHALAKESRLNISVMRGYGETLALKDNAFDFVYARQVLHHAQDLTLFCQQLARVIKPGGRFVAIREHVISRASDLDEFLANHFFHKFCGGENAFMLDEYVSAIEKSGLRILKIFGPFDSVINYFPMTFSEWRKRCIEPWVERIGYRPTNLLVSQKHFVGRFLLKRLSAQLSASLDLPGRMYSFIASKPA